MTTSHFYFEHTSTKHTDIWVQWLTDDGLGVPNLDQWTAYMDIDQGTSPTVVIPDSQFDQAASAFFFHLEGTHLTPGTWPVKVQATNDRPPDGPDTHNYVIARGTVHVLTEEPI